MIIRKRQIDRFLIRSIQKKIDKKEKNPTIEIAFDYIFDYLKKVNNPYLYMDPSFFNNYINVFDEEGNETNWGTITLLQGFRDFCCKVCQKYYDQILAKEKEEFLKKVPKEHHGFYMYIEGSGLGGMIEDLIKKKLTNRITQEDLDNFTSTFTK